MNSVRIGIIGLGLVGRRHVDAIAHVSGVDVAGVVEIDRGGAEFARNQGLDIYSSVENLLLKARPDGVIISTPTPLHIPQALECVDRACPILIEKPISTHSDDAIALVNQAHRANVPVLVGHHRRFNPLVKRAHQIIKDGSLGEVRAIQATCWFYKPDEYFEKAPWRKRKGAGPISVNLVHDIDLLRYLVGEIASVQTLATPSVRGFENEDVAAMLLRFVNGAVGTITVSDSIVAPWSWEHTSREYSVYPVTFEKCYLIGGSKASLSIPDLCLWAHEGGKQDWWAPISSTCQIKETSDPLINQIRHFADVIKGRIQPIVSGHEGLMTLRVIEAIQRSAQTGEVITVADTEKEISEVIN